MEWAGLVWTQPIFLLEKFRNQVESDHACYFRPDAMLQR